MFCCFNTLHQRSFTWPINTRCHRCQTCCHCCSDIDISTASQRFPSKLQLSLKYKGIWILQRISTRSECGHCLHCHASFPSLSERHVMSSSRQACSVRKALHRQCCASGNSCQDGQRKQSFSDGSRLDSILSFVGRSHEKYPKRRNWTDLSSNCRQQLGVGGRCRACMGHNAPDGQSRSGRWGTSRLYVLFAVNDSFFYRYQLARWAVNLLTDPFQVGVYSLTWVFLCIYHLVPRSQRKPPTVVSHMIKYPPTGADEMTSIILSFSAVSRDSQSAHGIALTSFRVSNNPDGHKSAKPAIRIQGLNGELQVDGPAYSPTNYRIIPKRTIGDGSPSIKEHEYLRPGWGMFWEADEAARCIRDGKLESDVLDWEESIVIMRVMDRVRKQNDLVYPDKIESTEYPLDL